VSTSTPTERVAVSFSGSRDQKQLATSIYEALLGQGRFMASDAPIRVSMSSIIAFLGRDGNEPTVNKVEGALKANEAIFAIEEIEGEQYVVTTRAGHPPIDAYHDLTHTFGKRFITPKPKPETPPQPVRERPRVDPSWASVDRVLDDLKFEPEIGDDEWAETEPLEIDEVIEAGEVAEVAEVEVEEPATARTITVPSAPGTDVSSIDDFELADAISDRLRADIRVANFGDQWMLEERVPRFSRGDLRRFKDYIQEQEQPLTDDALVQDVLGVRPGSGDFDLIRFAINFRLSREHRDFDFVGTTNQRFWSTSNLPTIGTTRRKPNEIGTDYRFLVDELQEEPAYRSIDSVDHVLTFYEFHLGLLPYNAELQKLLPAPVQANQRSAVLTFECPQSYTTYLVELRYPTPNRGGFILGLDDFFTENLVPGALLSISRTENDGHYLVEYLAAGNQNARLLELEDRRQRYVFRPTTYACAVADEMLLTEERFPKLGSEKPLDEKIRRRPESVVATTFERIGEENDGHGFSASFAGLFAAVNIERPFSDQFLREILDKDETGAFARDPDGADVYTYVPGQPS
jgi:hypothetical protein